MTKNSSLRLIINTPKKIYYTDFIKSVTFFDEIGPLTLLKNYEPTIGKVNQGYVRIIDISSNEHEFIVGNGLYCVVKNELNLLTNFCIKNTTEAQQKFLENRKRILDILTQKKIEHFGFEFEANLFRMLQKLTKKTN